jgi:phenylacetic acid degradation operon negative regulatory protein
MPLVGEGCPTDRASAATRQPQVAFRTHPGVFAPLIASRWSGSETLTKHKRQDHRVAPAGKARILRDMDPLQPLLDNLHSDGRPRVWSLVITIFGDSVQHRGGRIETARLNKLIARLGIESGALRTALSRLSRDGWVEGQRNGRTSSYTLTPAGLEQAGPATTRIYAAPRIGPVETWCFSTIAPPDALRIAGGWLTPHRRATDGFQICGALGSESAQAVWTNLAPSHVAALEKTASDVRSLEDLTLDPLDALAARTLLIHRWRRLVLRWPEVPAELMPDTFSPGDIHAAVAAAYAHLSPAAESWLDQAIDDTPAMPSAGPGQAKRFASLQTS